MSESIVIALAEGFEETEAIAPADVLKRLGFEVILAGVERERVRGAHGIIVTADCEFKVLKPGNARVIMLPGGMPGSVNLRDNDLVIDFVGKMFDAGKVVAAICAAPIALAKAGVTTGKKITAYPGFEDQLEGAVYTGARVERDGNIITAKGPGTAFEFAAEIAKALGKADAVAECLESMFVE